MSLRLRLSIIISMLFLTCMLLGVSFLVTTAKTRIANEVASSASLTYQLLDALLPDGVSSANDPDHLLLLQRISALEEARHMDISISNRRVSANTKIPEKDIAAPAWFVALVATETLVFNKDLNNTAGDVITIRTNAADEIAEVWAETRIFLVLLLLVLLALNSILFLIVGHWFTPVTTILHSLEEVELGKFGASLPSRALPELKIIADRIHHLSLVLRASREENDKLARRSLSIQEEERKHLAQELHDEMGQSISAIKAIAFSIAERNSEDAMSREGATRIGKISNNVRDHIRSMMHRLRPLVLDELGLVPALEHMVDEWNRNHSNIFCSLRTAGSFVTLNDEQHIHLYRIVQEALTNVAAHSRATTVEVRLEAAEQIQLLVKDNGCGFNKALTINGMGLSGMQERVTALLGTLRLDTAPDQGVTIHLVFPRN